MIRVALCGLRGHPAALAGTFVSIALAVLLVTVTLSCAIAAQRPEPAAADPELADLATVLLANAAAVAVLAAAFTAASTLAYSAARRQGELALLRLAGAGAGRVGAVLVLEALLIGALAASVGVAVGLPAARAFAGALPEAGLAPVGLDGALAVWPAWIAAGVGIAAVLLGALPVAIGNARIPPITALREAVAPPLRMTPARWIAAALLAAGALAELPLLRGAEDGTIAAYLVMLTITLIPLFAACSPVVARGLLALLATVHRGGGAGLIAVTAARTDLRRFTATATPILVTLALGAGILSGSGTVSATLYSGVSTDSADAVAVFTVVGLTLAYTAISIAVVFAMSTARRRRELTALRLAGASRARALGIVALDVALVLAVATVQATVITALVVLAAAWSLVGHAVVVDVPLGTVLLVLGCCALLAAASALLSARGALADPMPVGAAD
ncbi:hypothetical protein GCM10009853_029540 [Glycomyces scopariae]